MAFVNNSRMEKKVFQLFSKAKRPWLTPWEERLDRYNWGFSLSFDQPFSFWIWKNDAWQKKKQKRQISKTARHNAPETLQSYFAKHQNILSTRVKYVREGVLLKAWSFQFCWFDPQSILGYLSTGTNIVGQNVTKGIPNKRKQSVFLPLAFTEFHWTIKHCWE